MFLHTSFFPSSPPTSAPSTHTHTQKTLMSSPADAAGKRDVQSPAEKEKALQEGGDDTAQRFQPAADVPTTGATTKEVEELQQEAAMVRKRKDGGGRARVW